MMAIVREEMIFDFSQFEKYPHLLRKKYDSAAWFENDELYKHYEYVFQDQIQGNLPSVQQQMNDLISTEKGKFALVIEKYISEAFDESIRTVERELSVKANSIFDTVKSQSTRQTLVNNAVTLNAELFDAVQKDIVLILTNRELAGVPFTNAELKKEVNKIFQNKAARLASQVITETTRATSAGLEFGYRESGVITHKQWQAVLDDKTTVICQTGNGEIRQIGEPFSTGDFGAPFHINCRSRIQGLTISESNQ